MSDCRKGRAYQRLKVKSMMKLLEIKELPTDEISEQLKKSQIELINLKMKFASRQLEDPSQIRKKRKEIARLHTVRTQKLHEVSSEPKVSKIKKVKKKAVSETESITEKPKHKISKTKKGETK